jgi:hypothetical protein
MKKYAIALALTLLAVMAVADSGKSLLEFHRMAAVFGPFTGIANPIRGVPGAGFNWKIASANVELSRGGQLEVEVRGLVLDDVRAGAANGTNPLPSFRAAVNCQVISSGQAGIVNVSTTDFPATTTGNAQIEQKLILPRRCFAPIVFVTTTTGSWLAVSGF